MQQHHLTVNTGGNQTQSDFDSDLNLDPNAMDAEAAREQHIRLLINGSLVANCLLFGVKLYAAVVSHSLAVIGSALDSFLDLLTQIVIFAVNSYSKIRDRTLYPAGLSRLEPIGVILCASIMGMAALELVLHSILQLMSGHHQLFFSITSISILILAIVIKIVLYIMCSAMVKYSPSMLTLAEDHRNDVVSNTMALITGLLAHSFPSFWWMDPIGAILLSVYIAFSWVFIAREQIEMLVGKAAPPEFIEKIRAIADRFHPQMKLDILRAYHFGTRFLVEVEMVLPKDKTVKWAHDRSLKLQKLLEQIEDVERAYVHCDWKARDEDEHDWEHIRQKFKDKVRRLQNNYHERVSYQQALDMEITVSEHKTLLSTPKEEIKGT